MIKTNKLTQPIRFFFCYFFLIFFQAYSVNADTLLQIYHQAQKSDPKFAQAQSNWESEKMNLPIARSNYLPQLTALANGSRNHSDLQPPTLSTIKDYYWQYGYSLTLSQPLYDMGAWQSIKSADAIVKAATASYLAAQQSLIQRTTKAYFKVLEAYDTLHYTIANKRAVLQQLKIAESKFKTGLIAITDVYDARSRYDDVLAQQITAQNNLSITLESLRVITGQYYKKLYGISRRVLLVKPKPNNIDRWAHVALQQNYNIQSQNYNVIAALKKVKQIAAGSLPTLDLSSGFTETKQESNTNNKTTTDLVNLGLNLAYKPIQGGLVYASTKQARYDYVTASGKLEDVHRQVINQVRSSFLSVLSSINRVKADEERIFSARNALAATEAGMRVGTRTMIDVLNNITALYQAEQQHANDQYTYLNEMISLKEAAGTLSDADVEQLSHGLKKPIAVLSEQENIVVPKNKFQPKTISQVLDKNIGKEKSNELPSPMATIQNTNAH